MQLQTYLKASAFRQKIEGFKKKIGGAAEDDDVGGEGGGASRRLASDESREFVFRRDGKRARAPGGQGGERGCDDESRKPLSSCPHRHRSGGLSAANAAALAALELRSAPVRMAPLSTRVALAAFKGTSRQELEEASAQEVELEGGPTSSVVRSREPMTRRSRPDQV